MTWEQLSVVSDHANGSRVTYSLYYPILCTSADWKVAPATRLKRKLLCKNPWISQALNMGAGPSISRYCSELENGKRPKARKLLRLLDQ